MHPRCCRPVAWKRRHSASRLQASIIPVHYTRSCNTQSSAPEDGRDNRPKLVELIEIISKLLLLYLVGVYFIYINDTRSNKYRNYILSQILERTFFETQISLKFWKMEKAERQVFPSIIYNIVHFDKELSLTTKTCAPTRCLSVN